MVPVEPGLTNVEKEENGQRIVGMNTENAEINEGLIRFDIIFYVRMKDSHIRLSFFMQRKDWKYDRRKNGKSREGFSE